MVNVDGWIVIGGTPGPRDWYANLLADPRLTVHFKTTASVDIPATAVPLTDPDQRRRVYDHRSTAWYRSQVSVDDLVAAGPTVVLDFANGI